MVPDDAARDAALIREAIAAAGAGPAQSEQAADLTITLVFGRTSEEVYGVCIGVAAYALDAVRALNADPKVDRPPDTGVWTLGHLRPALADEEPEPITAGPPRRVVTGRRTVDPGERFAYDFTTAFEARPEFGDDETVSLFNGLAVQGIAVVTYGVSHLIKHVAAVTERALALHLKPAGGPT
jgi:hypothetical protein